VDTLIATAPIVLMLAYLAAGVLTFEKRKYIAEPEEVSAGLSAADYLPPATAALDRSMRRWTYTAPAAIWLGGGMLGIFLWAFSPVVCTIFMASCAGLAYHNAWLGHRDWLANGKILSQHISDEDLIYDEGWLSNENLTELVTAWAQEFQIKLEPRPRPKPSPAPGDDRKPEEA
jgi:hypothetical protein